jgi:hypothetical protein
VGARVGRVDEEPGRVVDDVVVEAVVVTPKLKGAEVEVVVAVVELDVVTDAAPKPKLNPEVEAAVVVLGANDDRENPETVETGVAVVRVKAGAAVVVIEVDATGGAIDVLDVANEKEGGAVVVDVLV